MNFGIDDINGRLRSAIESLGRSGATASRLGDFIVGTSFDKRIISEKGIGYANNEIARARAVRSFLLRYRKEVDDLLFNLDEYIQKIHARRQRGFERIANRQEINSGLDLNFEEYDDNEEKERRDS